MKSFNVHIIIYNNYYCKVIVHNRTHLTHAMFNAYIIMEGNKVKWVNILLLLRTGSNKFAKYEESKKYTDIIEWGIIYKKHSKFIRIFFFFLHI